LASGTLWQHDIAGQIANVVTQPRTALLVVLAKQLNSARTRPDKVQYHANSSRFASAIRTEQAINFAGLNR
jgi:hypothetical protein